MKTSGFAKKPRSATGRRPTAMIASHTYRTSAMVGDRARMTSPRTLAQVAVHLAAHADEHRTSEIDERPTYAPTLDQSHRLYDGITSSLLGRGFESRRCRFRHVAS
jgi:hypothetical protein